MSAGQSPNIIRTEEIQNILNKARVLFMRYGVKSTTMDDVASGLGISKKTLYKYFTDKADLLLKIVAEHTRDEQEHVMKIRKTAENAIHEMVAISQLVQQSVGTINPSVPIDLQKYYHDSWDILESYRKGFVADTVKGNIIRGREEGLYRLDFNTDIAVGFYLLKSESLFNSELFPPSLNMLDLFKTFIDLHIRSIATEKGMEIYLQMSENLK